MMEGATTSMNRAQAAKPCRRVRREPLKTRFLCRDGRGSPSEKRYESTFWSKPPDVCGRNTLNTPMQRLNRPAGEEQACKETLQLHAREALS
jgi:hypothetical protein